MTTATNLPSFPRVGGPVSSARQESIGRFCPSACLSDCDKRKTLVASGYQAALCDERFVIKAERAGISRGTFRKSLWHPSFAHKWFIDRRLGSAC